MKFNPFTPNYVANPNMFAGRVDESEAVKVSLFQAKHGTPTYLLLSGEHGIGKSSFLHYVRHLSSGKTPCNEETCNFLAVQVNLSEVVGRIGIVKGIIVGLRSTLGLIKVSGSRAANVLKFQSQLEGLSTICESSATCDSLNHIVENLVSVFLGVSQADFWDGIAVFFDEADFPITVSDLGTLLEVFAEEMSKRTCNNVFFIVAGEQSAISRLREDHESFFGNLNIFELMALSKDEQRNVIQSGACISNEFSHHEVRICEAAIEKLIELSDGYPHFLQQYASSSFDADIDGTITRDDVIRGVYSKNGAVARIGANFFHEFCFDSICSSNNRSVLKYMSGFGDSWVSRKDIVESAGIDAYSVTNALRVLKQRSIILPDEGRRGCYRLPTRAFAVWISALTDAQPR